MTITSFGVEALIDDIHLKDNISQDQINKRIN